MSTDDASSPGSVRLWSAQWEGRSWRLSRRADNSWRSIATVATPSGGVHVETLVHSDLHAAWQWIAPRWMDASGSLYLAAEHTFLTRIGWFRTGAPGFRPGSSTLRRRAEDARDHLYAIARWSGRTWIDLVQSSDGACGDIPVPNWLAYAVDDVTHGDGSIPGLEHWIPAPNDTRASSNARVGSSSSMRAATVGA